MVRVGRATSPAPPLGLSLAIPREPERWQNASSRSKWAFGMASALPNSATFPPPAGAQAPGDAIIVGAGPAGLACAAMMREAGLEPLVIEKTDTIASVWRRHYESMHLHSERAFSALPGLPMSSVLTTGNLKKLGLSRINKGPRRLIAEHNRVPTIDAGTLRKIREGRIKVRGAITRFTRDGVTFEDSDEEAFGAVIFATGFRTDLREILPDARDILDGNGYPLTSGSTCNEPGLYFCGTKVSPAGQLREMGIEAKRIAHLAKQRLNVVGLSL